MGGLSRPAGGLQHLTSGHWHGGFRVSGSSLLGNSAFHGLFHCVLVSVTFIVTVTDANADAHADAGTC